jgi:hypothetical protein
MRDLQHHHDRRVIRWALNRKQDQPKKRTPFKHGRRKQRTKEIGS